MVATCLREISSDEAKELLTRNSIAKIATKWGAVASDTEQDNVVGHREKKKQKTK